MGVGNRRRGISNDSRCTTNLVLLFRLDGRKSVVVEDEEVLSGRIAGPCP
jgi:hypothetical protein